VITERSLRKGKKALEELTKAKIQVEESVKIKEQFLANMSHEIRTPMNAIVGFTDLVLKTPLTAEQKQYIDAIHMSGENLLVIINDILDFSRLQSGKISFEQIGFHLSQVISTCTELLLPRSVEKSIKLSTVIDKNIPDHLTGDPTRLNQVLLIRLDPAQLSPEAKANSAEGVVAYSAICTHQGCDVSQWKTDTNTLLCVCHGSEFDPKDRAKVTFGPAPRRLAMLPVKVVDGVVMVASAFKGKPGFMDL